MLTIVIPEGELWNSKTEEFITVQRTVINLEHSLISISKWEAKWNKAFLGKQQKTSEEVIDYIRCMTIGKELDPKLYGLIPKSEMQKISDYISSPMSATHLTNRQNEKPSRETVTSELIYYWMVSFQIPFECEKWHLNRLLKLIEVCSAKNTPNKKMTKGDIKKRNATNAARRKALNSRG